MGRNKNKYRNNKPTVGTTHTKVEEITPTKVEPKLEEITSINVEPKVDVEHKVEHKVEEVEKPMPTPTWEDEVEQVVTKDLPSDTDVKLQGFLQPPIPGLEEYEHENNHEEVKDLNATDTIPEDSSAVVGEDRTTHDGIAPTLEDEHSIMEPGLGDDTDDNNDNEDIIEEAPVDHVLESIERVTVQEIDGVKTLEELEGSKGNELTEEIFFTLEEYAIYKENENKALDEIEVKGAIFEADIKDYPGADEFITILKDYVKTSKIRPFVNINTLIGIKYNLLIPITKLLQCPTSFLLAFKTVKANEELSKALPTLTAMTYKGRWKWGVDELMKIDLIISLMSIYVSGVKTNTKSYTPNYGEQLRVQGATEAVISVSRFIDQ